MKNNHEVKVLSTKGKNMKNKTLIKLALIVSLALSLQADYTRDATKNVVTDNSSGLMWQDDEVGTTMNWATALTTCEALTLGGYSDWRLPNYNELYNLADRSRFNPAISPVFTNVVSGYYWTSTTGASDTSGAWRVYFDNGLDYWGNKTYSYYVRCVRGGI